VNHRVVEPWLCVVVAIGLGSGLGIASCSEDPQEPEVDCRAEQAEVLISAEGGTVQSDGSVTVYGTIRFAPLYGLGEQGGEGGVAPFERTVRAVYVGPVAATTQFNFRTWSAHLDGDVLSAYADEMGNARVPVDAYIYGGCVAQLAEEQRPVVEIPPMGSGGMGSGGGGSGGDGGGGSGGDGGGGATGGGGSGGGGGT
jgi:hypothetical protein